MKKQFKKAAFYVDVGNIPSHEIDAFIQEIMKKEYKKAKEITAYCSGNDYTLNPTYCKEHNKFDCTINPHYIVNGKIVDSKYIDKETGKYIPSIEQIFEEWFALPETDLRTIDEYVASGYLSLTSDSKLTEYVQEWNTNKLEIIEKRFGKVIYFIEGLVNNKTCKNIWDKIFERKCNGFKYAICSLGAAISLIGLITVPILYHGDLTIPPRLYLIGCIISFAFFIKLTIISLP